MLERQERTNTDPIRGVRLTATAPVGQSGSPVEIYLVSPEVIRSKEALLSDSSLSHTFWKTCEHYKCSTVANSGSNVVTSAVNLLASGGYYRECKIDDMDVFVPASLRNGGLPINGLPFFFIERSDGGFVPPPEDLESMTSFAIKAMMPKIKAELSLINSVIELKDFLTFRSTIESVKDTIVNLFKKGFNRQTLAETFRTKADVYLQYKFNISPLLSDISGIYRSLANTERRINDFITRSGRVRTSHYSRFLTESNDDDSDTFVGSWDQVSYKWPEGPSAGTFPFLSRLDLTRFVKTEPASFHVQVQYNYNYTGYQVEHARILALLDALGVNLNPAIIWNAIPWSFVVDWVIGVGRYLDSLKVGAMDPKINILRCLWSIKRKRRILLSGSMTNSVRFSFPDRTPPASLVLPTIEETAYRRSPFNVSGSLLEASGLTPTEFSLGAALVISRRRRPKRLRR